MTLPNYLPVGTESAGTFVIGPGGLIDGASGVAGRVMAVQELSLPVTAVTNTDFVMSLPAGATVHAMKVYTTTAYTGTTANITVGNVAAGNQYVTAADISGIGIATLTLVAASAAALLTMPAAPNIFIRIAQSTTPTAVGAGKFVITYST